MNPVTYPGWWTRNSQVANNFSAILLIGLSESYLNIPGFLNLYGLSIAPLDFIWILSHSPILGLQVRGCQQSRSLHLSRAREHRSRAPTLKQDLLGSLIALSDFLIPFSPSVSQRAQYELTCWPDVVFRVTTCIVVFCIHPFICAFIKIHSICIPCSKQSH